MPGPLIVQSGITGGTKNMTIIAMDTYDVDELERLGVHIEGVRIAEVDEDREVPYDWEDEYDDGQGLRIPPYVEYMDFGPERDGCEL